MHTSGPRTLSSSSSRFVTTCLSSLTVWSESTRHTTAPRLSRSIPRNSRLSFPPLLPRNMHACMGTHALGMYGHKHVATITWTRMCVYAHTSRACLCITDQIYWLQLHLCVFVNTSVTYKHVHNKIYWLQLLTQLWLALSRGCACNSRVIKKRRF